MGRPRKHHRHLPQRMYLRRGTYYFAHPDGRWINLGKNESVAYRAYGDHMASTLDHETMSAVFARYRLDVIPLKAPATQRGNLQQIKNLERVFGHMKPSSIRAKHAYDFLDANRASPHQANREFEVLSHALTKCVEWGAIERNPLIGVRKLKVKARDREVKAAEYRAAYKLATPMLQLAMDLAVLTGQRERAILGLTLADAKKDGLHMMGTKGGRAVVVAWSPRLLGVVKRAKSLYGSDSGAMLRSRFGRAITPSGFQTAWQRYMARVVAAGIGRFNFHDLRAVAASRSKDPQKLLGHTSRQTTERVYLRGPVKVQPTG